MFRALILAVVLAATMEGADAALFNGRAADRTGAAVPGAAVTLYEQSGAVVFRTVTNVEGEFFFAGMLPGIYLIEAYAPGLSTPTAYEVKLAAGPNPDVQLVLIVSSVAQHVNVTAAGAPQSGEQTSKALDAISSGTAANRGLFLVSEALRFVPGLQVSTLGGPGAFADIQSRGLPAGDTAVLIDGSPFRDPASPQDDASTLIGQMVLVNTARMEVLRGSGSSLYGTNAASGTANLLTGGGGGPVHGDVDLQGGGLGLFEGVARIAGGFDESKLSYVAGFAHLQDAGEPSAAHDWTGQGGLQYAFSPGMHAAADLFGSESAIAGSAPVSQSIPFSPFVQDAETPSQSHFFDGLFRFSDEVNPAFSYRVSYAVSATERNFESDRYEGLLNTANARASYSLGTSQILSAGYEFTSEHYSQLAPDASTRAGQDFQSAYGSDELQLLHRRLAILLSGRYTGVGLDRPGAVSSAGSGDASAAYFFARTGTKIRAHVGNGFRMPSLYERFGGYVYANQFRAVGNPDLLPEQSVSSDAGVEQYLWAERVQLSANYFDTLLQHPIAYEVAAVTPGYYNVQDGRARGVELIATLRPARRTSLTASYTFTQADAQLQAFGVSRNEVKFVAGQTFGARFDGALDLDAGSSYLFLDTYRFGGPKQLGVSAGYRLLTGTRLNPRLYVRISNALNQHYVADGFDTPGRWAVAGLQLAF